MALTHVWWGAAVLAVALVTTVFTWWWPRRRATGDVALFGAARRLRSLPRFRALARRRVRWLVVECVAVAVALAGAALLVAHPVDATSSPEERSNRDVVLCLDVSGSMEHVVLDVLGAFEGLAGRLDGERIGLVLFDSSAVTMFPLTDDGDYVRDELRAAASEVSAGRVPGTALGDVGTSLIGDGLASCLQRFDDADPHRSRTVVLATDNQTSGKSLVSLDAAVDRARARSIVVFGVTPNDNAVAAAEELRAATRRADGETLFLAPGAALSEIVEAVHAQPARTLAGPPRHRARPQPWPAFALLLPGLVGAALARRRRLA
ncbi:vWA domain-containing protein [uncultured Tessaracoccus sp.]|uniref:vWA domain-containing protein n=1 Tax=uncultured Tessaracoccus sp. TaxID=905023 RepID=UPI0025E33D62|nr:vWA domain-containing protein [uncultured Tessaracoccus sp.]